MIDFEARNALVEQHLDLPRIIARKLIKELPPCIDTEELVSAGNVGLIAAAARFDPVKFPRVKFPQYAHRRVRGAMLDSIRRKNWDMATSPPLEDVEEEPNHTPDAVVSIDRGLRAKILREALADIPFRERTLLVEHYFNGKLLAQAGLKIKVGTTRTTQIHAKALESMKAALRRRNVDRAA